jgi:hypothetical protein
VNIPTGLEGPPSRPFGPLPSYNPKTVRSLIHSVSNFFAAHEEAITTGLGGCVFLAFIGIFLEKRLPLLHPFVLWTIRIYLGAFVAGIAGIVIVAPGVLVAKDFYSCIVSPDASAWERRLSQVWCVGAGVMFTMLIGAAYVLEATGRVVNIKVWFVSLCFVVLILPYAMLGMFFRWVVFRRNKKGPLP